MPTRGPNKGPAREQELAFGTFGNVELLTEDQVRTQEWQAGEATCKTTTPSKPLSLLAITHIMKQAKGTSYRMGAPQEHTASNEQRSH